MTEPKKKPQPPRSILDPDFQYVPACRTDIRQTFARVRERMAQRSGADTESQHRPRVPAAQP